jgi:hypothetical protein
MQLEPIYARGDAHAHGAGATEDLALGFHVPAGRQAVSMTFVYRSSYGMRIESE